MRYRILLIQNKFCKVVIAKINIAWDTERFLFPRSYASGILILLRWSNLCHFSKFNNNNVKMGIAEQPNDGNAWPILKNKGMHLIEKKAATLMLQKESFCEIDACVALILYKPVWIDHLVLKSTVNLLVKLYEAKPLWRFCNLATCRCFETAFPIFSQT